MRSLKATLATIAVSVLGMAAATQAAPVAWSPPSGTVPGFFSYSNGGSDNGLFGNPTISGNTFTFFPSDFRATAPDASNGNALTDITQDRLFFTLDVAPGQVFESVTVREFGDFLIQNGGTVGEETFLFVTNLSPNSPFQVVTQQAGTNPTFPLTTAGNQNGLWDATASVNLLANGWNRIQVSLNNILTATVSSTASVATIQKKVGGITITVNIPEPASMSLLAGSLGMLMVRRRK